MSDEEIQELTRDWSWHVVEIEVGGSRVRPMLNPANASYDFVTREAAEAEIGYLSEHGDLSRYAYAVHYMHPEPWSPDELEHF